MTEWTTPRKYNLGATLAWHGIELVCTREHYAGDAALHPWDPGIGWDPVKQATLWTPRGQGECCSIVEMLAGDTDLGLGRDAYARLLEVLKYATGIRVRT